MQIVWEESGCLLLSHQDTLFQKLTGQIGVSEDADGHGDQRRILKT